MPDYQVTVVCACGRCKGKGCPACVNVPERFREVERFYRVTSRTVPGARDKAETLARIDGYHPVRSEKVREMDPPAERDLYPPVFQSARRR